MGPPRSLKTDRPAKFSRKPATFSVRLTLRVLGRSFLYAFEPLATGARAGEDAAMTNTRWIVIALAAVLFTGVGCKKKEAGTEPAAKTQTADPAAPAATTPTTGTPAIGTPAPPATPAAPATMATGTVDQSSPTKVTEAVFAAAASGNTDQLKGLCDPKGEGDGDTKDICGMTAASPKLGEFKEYFAKGKATKETITGDAAEVTFLFGPDGTKDETMKLVRRDGKWYLSSF